MSTKKTTPAPSAPDIVDENEFAIAKKEAEKADESIFSYTHEFRRPFTYEGKTYEELTFDFGKLTGEDGIAIQEELEAKGKPVIVQTMNANYLCLMAARACTTTIGADVLMALPLYDFNRIIAKARSFLLKSEL